MEERLQKCIAASGLMSRRKAEALIAAGRVRLNGNTAHLGDTADLREDIIEIDGIRLPKQPDQVYLVLHKPRGFVTTLHDEQGRRSVADLLADCPTRVWPVGRLDCASEGLLLCTNDGCLANRLMHPRHQVDKVYLAWVSGFHEGAAKRLLRPIVLDGRPIAPPQVRQVSVQGQTALLEITIHEGRNRQIRRMCEAAELHVTRLRRIAEGPLRLGKLPAGHWRYLEPEEIAALKVL